MEELALKVEHVSKEYRLGAIGGATLKKEIQSKLASLRHKEDPNLKIGEKAHDKNERFLALDDVNFEIKKGERIGIIGHNGAGKSTVLKLICRVTAPSKGNIYFNGRITSMLEVGTGFHDELTGRENIYLNGAILGMSRSEIDKKFDEIVEFSEVGKFIDTPTKRYSSGMKVKLGFAVASHLDSEIMIMDEVLAVGDMAFQKKCIAQMRKVAEQEGRTILYVSHNMNTIRQLCDRVIVLDHGHVVFDGDVEEGIRIYMPGESGSRSVDVDLRDQRMDYLPQKIDAKLLHLTIPGKVEPVFETGEKLEFLLKIKTYEELGPLSLRFELRTDDGEPVGSSVMQNFARQDRDTEKTYRVSLGFGTLVPGDYAACIVLYSIDPFGVSFDLDTVFTAVSFSVCDFKNNLKIVWNKAKWGRIKFDDMQIENAE